MNADTPMPDHIWLAMYAMRQEGREPVIVSMSAYRQRGTGPGPEPDYLVLQDETYDQLQTWVNEHRDS